MGIAAMLETTIIERFLWAVDPAITCSSTRTQTTISERSFRCTLKLGAFGTHRTELEFGNFPERIERRIGQQIRRGLRITERHEHHVLRHVAVGTHFYLHRAAP